MKTRHGADSSEVKRYRYRGMRHSRAGRWLLGRRQTRYDHQYRNYRQYRNDDIEVPGVFLGVYAFPFFPFGHCRAPCCALQFRLSLDDEESRLTSRDFTYFFAFFNLDGGRGSHGVSRGDTQYFCSVRSQPAATSQTAPARKRTIRSGR